MWIIYGLNNHRLAAIRVLWCIVRLRLLPQTVEKLEFFAVHICVTAQRPRRLQEPFGANNNLLASCSHMQIQDSECIGSRQ